MTLDEIIKYCSWYKHTNIFEIEARLETDNVPIKSAELIKSLCRGTINQELIANLVQLEKMAEYFISEGTMNPDVYKKRLTMIQKRIKDI